MDNEIPVFRVTVPEESFKELKESANSGGMFGNFNFSGWGDWDWNNTDWANWGNMDVNNTEGGFGGWGNWGGFGDANANNTDGGFGWGNWGGFGDANANNTDGGFGWGNWGGFGDANANNTDGGFGGWGDWGNNTWGSGSFNVFGDPYKIKDASMVVEINGGKKTFKKVTFTLGGSSSRIYGRQAFNLKIRGGKDLYGRSQFRIRSDAREATYLRSKLTCDIHNRLGLTSISANYISLYVNDEYLGLYILMDAPKLSWAELEFGDDDTNNLYKCKSGNNVLSVQTCATGCENENEESTDNSEWIEFLTAVDNAKSAEDIEDIFDVEQFLYEMAFEYLSGSWDHFLNTGHNFSMYKNPETGKWTIIYYDFDGELGQDVSSISMSFGNAKPVEQKDFTIYTFEEWANKPRHILDILIFNDPTRFENVIEDFITDAFNPATLFPRIDELKEFIKPHIIKDKTPDENGKCPGILNESGSDYTIEQWNANSEFTNISGSYGLKYWILERYRTVCKNYNIECDPVYMDENYEYSIDKSVEGNPMDSWFSFGGNDNKSNPKENESKTTVSEPTETKVPEPTTTDDDEEETTIPVPDEDEEKTTIPVIDDDEEETTIPVPDDDEEETTISVPTETTVSEPTKTTVSEPTEETQSIQCLAELIDYPCCDKRITKVLSHDEYGDWGYDFKKKEWCGLTAFVEQKNDEKCWSEQHGYPCCKSCIVYEIDEDGQWGYENNHWCGIQSFCSTTE